MPRPQKVTDDQIFEAVFRAMNRVGPADLSLALIAEEAGVTPGLIVQRFGSKHALQVRLAKLAADNAAAWLDDFRARHDSPLAALRAYVTCFAELAASPEAFTRSLAYLTEDLSDPDLRAHLERQSRTTRSGIEALLAGGVKRGELKRTTKVKRLARTIEAIIGGSMITWATYRKGKADRWMRRELDAVLEPHLRPSRSDTDHRRAP